MKSKVLKKSDRQTVQEGHKYSDSSDKKRKALPPGKRESANGNIYYEYRRDHTDLKGVDLPKRKVNVKKHTRNDGEIDVKKHERNITIKPASDGSKPPEISLDKQFEIKNKKILEGRRSEDFQDIGEKFGGAKKDYYANKRILEWEDILSLEENTADALQFITKSKIINPIDEQFELSKGTTSGTIYLKKLAYKYLLNKPKINSKEARAFYFKESTMIFQSLENIRTVDQFMDFQKEYNRGFWTRQEKPKYVKERLGASFFGFMTRTTKTAGEKVLIAKQLENDKATINKVDELLEQKKRESGQRGKTYKKPYLEHIERVGGKSIGIAKPELIIEKLGLRGVEYGNWVNDKEAQKSVKHFIGSMYDLEDMTGLDIVEINKSGKLGIAFGSRGTGSALAHFEPYRNVINLTKKNGDGSLAHEWGHYFDHILKSKFGDKENNSGDSATFLTNDIKNPKNKVQKAMKEVMDTIMKGEAVDKVEYEIPKGFKPSYNFENKYKQLKSIGGSIDEFFKLYVDKAKKNLDSDNIVTEKMARIYNYSQTDIEKSKKRSERKYNKYVKEIGQLIAYMEGKTVELGTETGKSQYYLRSSKQGTGKKNSYWTQSHELFARAFEGFIQDKLQSKGRKNNYLANGTGSLEMSDKIANEKNFPYPTGKERIKINLAIEKFLGVVKDAQLGKSIKIDHPVQQDNVSSLNFAPTSIYKKVKGNRYYTLQKDRDGWRYNVIEKDTDGFNRPISSGWALHKENVDIEIAKATGEIY